jgi:hypothetical protein
MRGRDEAGYLDALIAGAGVWDFGTKVSLLLSAGRGSRKVPRSFYNRLRAGSAPEERSVPAIAQGSAGGVVN